MSNTFENNCFGFPKVKWLLLTAEVDISVRFLCQIFSGFNVPKKLKSVNFFKVIKKLKVDVLGTQCIHRYHSS